MRDLLALRADRLPAEARGRDDCPTQQRQSETSSENQFWVTAETDQDLGVGENTRARVGVLLTAQYVIFFMRNSAASHLFPVGPEVSVQSQYFLDIR